MLKKTIVTTALAILTLPMLASANCPDELNQTLRKLHSKDTTQLCELYTQSKAMLMVNTASNCGFTKQFSDLEALHKKYQDQGLVVVGFPSNSFKQEEKDEGDTARVCFQNFGVTFTMTEHVPVKGDQAIAPFQYVSEKTRQPSWNFNKYLITKDGSIQHFGSRTQPLDSELEQAITKALAAQ